MTFTRKLIGRGAFTKAYQIACTGGDADVEIISTCPTKEMYALFSQGNKFAPKIERDCNKENTYKMPLYPKMKAPKKQLNVKAYSLYSILRDHKFWGKNYYGFIAKVSECENIGDKDKEAIIDLAGDVCNAIDPENMRFEISPRNVSCNKHGDLVLLDCFFCVKTLQSTRKR